MHLFVKRDLDLFNMSCSAQRREVSGMNGTRASHAQIEHSDLLILTIQMKQDYVCQVGMY